MKIQQRFPSCFVCVCVCVCVCVNDWNISYEADS